MTRREQHWLDEAAWAAGRSALRCRVGAVLVHGPVSVYGHNQRKTHPALKRWGYPEWADIHAELAALLHAGVERARGGTLYVVRLTHEDRRVLAKPCEACMGALVMSGVRRCVWSGEQGSPEEIKL